MPSDYPGALDTFSNPSSSDATNNVTTPHATQHADANDAIEAIQATLGIDPQGSETDVAARLTALEAGGGGAGALTLITASPFSSASSKSLDGCFDGTYDAYLVLVRITGNSASQTISMRLRASSTDLTSGYTYAILGLNEGAAADNHAASAAGSWFLLSTYSGAAGIYSASIDIFDPYGTSAKDFHVQSSGATSAPSYAAWSGGGYNASTTQYDGFTIYPNTGTITGTVWVYGYQKS